MCTHLMPILSYTSIFCCLQVLVPVVIWEVALASFSRTTVVVEVVVEGAGEVGVAMEEGVEEIKQLDSQMGVHNV